MANKTSFTTDEWTKLLESPMMAGIAITAAEPSGLWGLLKESLSSGWALQEAKTSAPNELIRALATDFGTSEGRRAARDEVQARLSSHSLSDIRDTAIAALREAAAIVQRLRTRQPRLKSG
jgi:thymidylate synthase ThyX